MVPLIRREIGEANASLCAVALPRHFCDTFDGVVGSRQSEFDAHGAGVLSPTCDFERHATLTDVRSDRLSLPRPVLRDQGHRNLHSHPRVAAAFALHQSPGRAKTGPGTFGG